MTREPDGGAADDYLPVPLGGGWELLKALPFEEEISASADDYDGAPGCGRRRGLWYLARGDVVAGVLYARSERLGTFYASDDHVN